MSRWSFPTFFALAILVLTMSTGSCAEYRLVGKPASHYFNTGKVAELANAAADGDLDRLNALAAEGVDVNAEGFEGINPLLWTMIAGNKASFAKLLELGADPFQQAKNEISVADDSTAADDPEFLKILLEHGVDPNGLANPRRNETLLMKAVLYSRWPQVELLLQHCADINWATEFGSSAATVAVSSSEMEMLVRFLEEGYSYDLDRLARRIDIRRIAEGHPQYQWEQKAIQILQERGVVFPADDREPAPPAASRAEPVYAQSCQERRKA